MAKITYTSKDKVPMTIYTGVKNSWQLELFHDDGTPLDATGYSYFCQVRAKPGGKLLAEMDIDLSQIAVGILTMSLTAVNSALIGARSGTYDILQREDADHTNVVPLFGGDAEIIPVSTEIPE
jgi:hypothetical protein